MRRIERALISVYDKTGIVDFAAALAELEVEILATGSTYKLLASKHIRVREVSDYTGFPELLDGRVKTLHPKIAGGLLAIRENPEHMRQAEENQIPMIDLVCVNLYPFAETIRKSGAAFEEIIENIDIGGPSLIRAAAKNFQDVAILTSPADYAPVLDGLRAGHGILERERLFALARKAFLCTARYDAQIAQHLSKETEDGFPQNIFMDFEKIRNLRYGENPHQRAALYSWGAQPLHGLPAAQQLQGPELSFNNIVDVEAAWTMAAEFEQTACCIIKHTNPCGAATGETVREAYLKAYEADSLSAFGSVIGFNRNVDRAAALELAKLKIDVIVAPGFDREAVEILATKKSLKLLSLAQLAGQSATEAHTGWGRLDIKTVSGGILLQDRNKVLLGEQSRLVTSREPTEQERQDLDFAWRIVKHVKSNGIVLANSGCTRGVGAGQMSRVDSVRISAQKAGTVSKGLVLASDAFFPFRDGIDEAARAGVTAIIQPGGSLRDGEVIAAAEEHGMAMIFTGLRHFKH